jgi:hypothetical protein
MIGRRGIQSRRVKITVNDIVHLYGKRVKRCPDNKNHLEPINMLSVRKGWIGYANPAIKSIDYLCDDNVARGLDIEGLKLIDMIGVRRVECRGAMRGINSVFILYSHRVKGYRDAKCPLEPFVQLRKRFLALDNIHLPVVEDFGNSILDVTDDTMVLLQQGMTSQACAKQKRDSSALERIAELWITDGRNDRSCLPVIAAKLWITHGPVLSASGRRTTR